MKKLVWLLLALLLCTAPAGAAVTEEEIHNVGGDTLAGAVPAEQREYLDGIQPETSPLRLRGFWKMCPKTAAARCGVRCRAWYGWRSSSSSPQRRAGFLSLRAGRRTL